MSKWNGWVLTEKGRELQAKVAAGKCQYEFKSILLGDGAPKELESCTELASLRATMPVNDVEIINENICRIEGSISNQTLENDLTVSEMGIIAMDPDEGEVLYGISVDAEPDEIPAAGNSVAYEQTVRVNIIVNNTADVVVGVDPAVFVSRKTLDETVQMIGETYATKEEILPDILYEMLAAISPANRNGIYRGKDLGVVIRSQADMDAFLAEHEVASGKFTGLFVGDMFMISDGTYNKKWYIAGFDTEYAKGDTDFNKHHLTLVPVEPLMNIRMNSTNTTEGGYKNSEMFKTTLKTADANLTKALGTRLLTHRVLLSNTMTKTTASGAIASWTGASSNWEWCDAKSNLMSEPQIYGGRVLSSSFYDVGEAKERLPIFNFKTAGALFGRVWFWTKAVAGSSGFCYCGSDGYASSDGASNAGACIPLICVG